MRRQGTVFYMTTEPGPQYDLRSLFKAVGRVGGRVGDVAAVERKESEEAVELIDSNPLQIDRDTLADVAGFVDGIQAHMHLTHRERRPVAMYYVAAGALERGANAVALVERLKLQCGEADKDWLEGLGSNIPIELLGGDTPPEMEISAVQAVGKARDSAERAVIDDLLARGGKGLIAVDGSLLARPRADRLVGIVKTTRSRYLSDERVIWNLQHGWRSPRFTIGTGNTLRYSCYVQLVEKGDGAWNLGLIRLESFDPNHLEPMAAVCLAEVQSGSSGDPRWDRHLGSVRAVEEFLRARRPRPFTM